MRVTALLAVLAIFHTSLTLSSSQGRVASGPGDMLASTVQIMVQIKVTAPMFLMSDDLIKTENVGWVGSGVIYDKLGGRTGPVHSRILTADHVVRAPKAGEVTTEFGMPLTIVSVEMTIRTHDGRTCNLKPLVLGGPETADVATAEADCDAGPAAVLADEAPPEGAKVYVSGHPLGIPWAVVTDGYVSGWAAGGYMLVSAPAAPGNSGGPIFYEGKVVGLLVRSANGYHHICLSPPLEKLLERVGYTESW